VYGGVEGFDFMRDHSLQGGLGMIGRGSTCPAPETTIEAFQPARGAQVRELPVGMLLVNSKVGDGGAEVSAEATDCLRLRCAIKPDHLAVAVEGSGESFGLPNVVKIAKNGLAPAALFLAGEVFVGDPNGVVEIAQFVEEAALLIGAKVHSVERGAETGPAIMDDEFKAIVATDAQGFQLAEKSQPVAFIFLVGQTPRAMKIGRLMRFLSGRPRPLASRW
jgi:hypothetical protein